MLTQNGIKQEASFVYLHALSAHLGYSLEIPRVDMDSVDATICGRGKIPGSKGAILSPKIDVQLKTTERESFEEAVPFSLSKKNYDDLRKDTMVPRMLVALFLPIGKDWFEFDLEKIVLYGRAYADYHQRVLEAVCFLAKCERSSEKQILSELLRQKSDLLKIRVRGDQIGFGCISYFDKGIIEEGVRKILLASARCIPDPKPYFKRLYSSSAEQWMKKCRALVPESGSYVLTVQLPLEDSEEKPFSRRVAEYLMKSLSKLVELSEKGDLLDERLESDLNANLCLGLAEMKPDETPIYFDFEMKWSPEIPLNQAIPARVEIQDRYFSSIARIGQKLKPQSEVNQNVFVGKVLTLHGEADERGQMQGEVTLILLMDEQQTKAKVCFGSEFYALACDAHKQNQYIRISGVLSEKPRYSDLKDVSHFEVIQ